MSKNKMTPRQSLRDAIDRCCVARGEAQWTNGYRGSKRGEDMELYEKEQRLWKHVSATEKRLEAFISRYATAIRNERKRKR